MNGEEILCKIQTHNKTTCVVQHAAVQMSGPHFTCGSGWPSTSLLSLHLLPSPCPIPCFSPLCQDFSCVSQHGVRASHKLVFSSSSFSPPPKHLSLSLSHTDDLFLVASGHSSYGKPEYPLSEKGELNLIKIEPRALFCTVTVTKQHLFLKKEAFPTAETKRFPSSWLVLLSTYLYVMSLKQRMFWEQCVLTHEQLSSLSCSAVIIKGCQNGSFYQWCQSSKAREAAYRKNYICMKHNVCLLFWKALFHITMNSLIL